MLRCSSFFLKTQTIVIQELTSKYGKLKKKNEKQLVNINFAECCCLTSESKKYRFDNTLNVRKMITTLLSD